MSAIVSFMNKFGLPVDVALVALMFVGLFGSLVVGPALYTAATGVIAVMSVFAVVQILAVTGALGD